MNQREYRIGPGAASLMLLVVVLSMSVLGMLALMSARSDENLSLRSAEVARLSWTMRLPKRPERRRARMIIWRGLKRR